MAQHCRVRMPHRDLAHAAEMPWRKLQRGIEQFSNSVPLRQVSMANDGRCDAAAWHTKACVRFGDFIRKLDLPQGPQDLWAGVPPAPSTLHVHGSADVVAQPDVGPVLIQQVSKIAADIQVMMRIDDPQVAVDDVFIRGVIFFHEGRSHAAPLPEALRMP
jgi:hypothetical protein